MSQQTSNVLLRRLFVIAALLDLAAGIAFLLVRMISPATIVDWVTTSPIFAGEVRDDGVAATVNYATIAVCVVHVFITVMFLWLAVAIGRGRQRVRATVMLIVTTCVDAFVITTPIAGITQQVVMAIAVAVKLIALAVLWAPISRRRPDLA